MKQKYDLRHLEEVERYIQCIDLIKGPFRIEEISNGNMNYVYRIKEDKSGKSYILKYAAEHTRISEDIPVSTDRIDIEAEALQRMGELVPDFVPHFFRYDSRNKCIIMEDCTGYSVMRDVLNQYQSVKDFSESITTYLIKSMLPTLLSTNAKEAEELFSNPLCDVTKEFVFTEPFDPNSSTNAIYEPNQDYVECEVFKDDMLLVCIESLKQKFSEKKQALIHGDLHTGSILVKHSSVIVFDYEFAFYGPIGFDIGNLVANLIFAWLHAKVNAADDNHDFVSWLEATICEVIDKVRVKFDEELNDRYGSYDRNTILDVDELIHDTASYAGVELLRRIIGIAHVSDMISIEAKALRVRAERIAIKLAKEYILQSNAFNTGKDFVNALKMNYENV